MLIQQHFFYSCYHLGSLLSMMSRPYTKVIVRLWYA